MDLVSSLPAFVVAVVLISASPGPAVVLIVRRAALRGWRGAVPTVLGVEAGLYAWALLAAAGFAALVAASEVAYWVLRVMGAVVLLVLGLRALRTAWRQRAAHSDISVESGQSTTHGWWRAFGEGATVQLANPKAAVFMMAFYPQFVPADLPLLRTTAALALLQVALETAIYLGLAAAVGQAGGWLGTPRARARVEAVTGTVLIGLGIRVAASTR
jgi:threonine/homoserine/homoserine lactone efflux protein